MVTTLAWTGAASAAAPKAQPALSYSQSDNGDGRFELTLSGTRFTSRDTIEGELLRRAAQLTISKGQDWFMLLHLPGEQPDKHPPRPKPAFGVRYGHWQPHWSYKQSGAVWQPWHPEWGTRFWADEVNPKEVQRFEVHAMIESGKGPIPAHETAFDAKQVIRDLAAPAARPVAARKRPTARRAKPQTGCC